MQPPQGLDAKHHGELFPIDESRRRRANPASPTQENPGADRTGAEISEGAEAPALPSRERATRTGRTVLEGKTIHVPDVLEDPEYSFFEGQKAGGDWYRAQCCGNPNSGSLLAVPLLANLNVLCDRVDPDSHAATEPSGDGAKPVC
jgi:hypothetical protein